MTTPPDPTTSPPRRLLSSGGLAHYLGVTSQTVRRYQKQGLITPAKVTPGGFTRWDLDEALEALGVQQEPLSDDTGRPL